MRMHIILPIFFVAFFLVLIFGSYQLSSRSVYGPMLKDSEIESFMDKHLDSYQVNEIAYPHSHMLTAGAAGLPYLSKLKRDSFASWYIEDYGRIPNGSKYTKILNERFELMAAKLPKKPALKDL